MDTVYISERGTRFPPTTTTPGLRLLNLKSSSSALIDLLEPLLLMLLSQLDCWAAEWVQRSCSALHRAVVLCYQAGSLGTVVATVGRGCRPTSFQQVPDYDSVGEALADHSHGIVAVYWLPTWYVEPPLNLQSSSVQLHGRGVIMQCSGVMGLYSTVQVQGIAICDVVPPEKLAQLMDIFESFEGDGDRLDMCDAIMSIFELFPEVSEDVKRKELKQTMRKKMPEVEFGRLDRLEFEMIARTHYYNYHTRFTALGQRGRRPPTAVHSHKAANAEAEGPMSNLRQDFETRYISPTPYNTFHRPQSFEKATERTSHHFDV